MITQVSARSTSLLYIFVFRPKAKAKARGALKKTTTELLRDIQLYVFPEQRGLGSNPIRKAATDSYPKNPYRPKVLYIYRAKPVPFGKVKILSKL